ncbi:MAG: hypothetical protein Kow00121_60820 [Elainellaceae cyanobacterium]
MLIGQIEYEILEAKAWYFWLEQYGALNPSLEEPVGDFEPEHQAV